MATTVTPSGAQTALDALTTMVRAMFPHPSFPDGPYQRCAQAILGAAADDVRFRTQLDQGLRDLDAIGEGPFAGLDEGAKLDALRAIGATEFFEGVRSRVITTLYDDREVWALLGYEGPSYDQGGYLERGYAELDWLPAPRIEEAS